MSNKIDILVNAVTNAAISGLKNVRSEIEGIGREAKATKEKNADFTAGLQAIAGKAAVVSGALLGVGAAIKKGYDFAREGAELDIARDKFDRLAESIGTTGDALLVNMQKATRGLVSDAELVAGASDLMSLGLVKNEQDAIRLSRVVGALDMNMNALTLTMTNKTTMRFDTLGVAVAGFDERLQTLIDSGMDADAAFGEAFLRQAEAQVEKVGEAADGAIAPFKRLQAHIQNVADETKKNLTPAFSELINNYLLLYDTGKRFDELMAQMPDNGKEFQESFDMTGVTILRQAEAVAHLEAQYKKIDDSMSSYDRALRNHTNTTAEIAGATETLSLKEGEFLSIVSSVGAEIESYNDKQDDLTQKRDEAQVALDKLIKDGWWVESQAVQDAQLKLNDYNQQLEENTVKFEDSTNRRILKRTEEILSADGLTSAEEKALLQMGVNMGIYTQEYIEQAQQVIDQSDALASAIGKIPTEKHISITASFIELASWNSTAMQNAASWDASQYFRADGGDVSAGSPYVVGEEGMEIFVPKSDGFIVPNHRLGESIPQLVGGGTTNVFINYSPGISTASREEVEQLFRPVVEKSIRDMKSNEYL